MATTQTPDLPAPAGAPKAKHRCRVFLRGLVERSASTNFARVDTCEACLAAARKAGGDDARSAAISSQSALGRSSAREMLRNDVAQSTIVTRHGIVASLRIPSARGAYVVSIGTDATLTLALALRGAFDAAENLASIIDAVPPAASA